MLISLQNYSLQNYSTQYSYLSRSVTRPIFKASDPAAIKKLLEEKLGSITDPEMLKALALVGLAALTHNFNPIKNSQEVSDLRKAVNANSKEGELPQANIPVKTKQPAQPSKSREQALREYKTFFEHKPERNEIFDKYLKNYKNLSKKYEELIINRIMYGHDKETTQKFSDFEYILGCLPKLEKKYINNGGDNVNPRAFLENLNTYYFEKFDDIYTALVKERNLERNSKGGSYIHIMKRIERKDLEPEYLKEYMKYPNLTYFEYHSTRRMKLDNLLQYFNNMKETYNIRQYRLTESKHGAKPLFAIKCNSSDNKDNLKTIVEIFEKINQDIVLLHSDKINKQVYTAKNIQEEVSARLIDDRSMILLYNFIKFVSPDFLKEYNYTEDELKSITKDNEATREKYFELMGKIGEAHARLDYENNTKLKDIIEVINNKEMFRDYIDNIHTIFFFICKFVINEKYDQNSNFKDVCEQKFQNLKSAIETSLKNTSLIYCHTPRYSAGIAPSFYLIDENNLGPNLRITLNRDGEIHSMLQKNKKDGSDDDYIE